MNWEKYGVRIGVEEGSLLSSETVEAAVVALVGGQFEFPPNTVLVSAVYAVSLSKPLLKRLKLEIQHCVDLTGRPGLSHYLKFAIAPVSTPSLPYQFSVVEEGEFSSNSGYGSIQRKKFCLVCILGEESTNGDSDSEDDENGSNDDSSSHSSDSSSGSDKTGGPPGASNGAANESNQEEEEEEEEDEGDQELGDKTEAVTEGAATPLTVSDSKNESELSSTDKFKGIGKFMRYTGMLYYEKDGVEDLVTFTAAKKLNALIKYITKKHSHAKTGQYVYFHFKDKDGYIELQFDAPQDEPVTGWDIKPHMKPCRLYRCDVDNFGSKDYPLPPSCLISVYGSPDAVPTLHYSIPLEGVADPVTLNIHRARRNPPPSTDPTTSSSNVVHESASVSSTGGANLASQLYAAYLIREEIGETRSMEKFIAEFKASLSFMRKLPKVQEHCQKFLNSFIAVRGSYANAAEALVYGFINRYLPFTNKT
ncbi:PREDICTED: uncharacterized protein LOC109587142 [Amphimedon queenslandica]|uniref:Uncharacterized protein n=1 Tax=Amphimedon queenslandica TaxID=400682 RepID=A0AAN0JQ44_AMPQE|nr:PREDICTED: uncharacterized protein LOC109587142 [Amphimedon queenslandica]|eukprot:XP_019858937.1 PREDICTED: uncharacterized protein LOC109587142 [Amphimedon queenslandica]